MNAEQQQHNSQPATTNINWSQLDQIKHLFNRNTPVRQVDEGFESIRKNLNKEPHLIIILVDYYFFHSSPATSAFSSAPSSSGSSSGGGGVCLLNDEYNGRKTIIDLICAIPEDLCLKLFDKIYDYMKQYPQNQHHHQHPSSNQNQLQSLLSAASNQINLMHSSPSSASFSSQQQQQQQIISPSTTSTSSNISSSNQQHYAHFEKLTYLLVSISYRQTSWLGKLVNHALFAHLAKTLKSNSTWNELIVVHTSLLFVTLMTNIPAQLFSQLNENLFHIYINLFKYLTHLEQTKVSSSTPSSDSLILRSVRWSVRLCFYVCYGSYANQFIQFLRKKEQHALNKDHLTSIFFYLRFHPALLKEKIDSSSSSSSSSTTMTTTDKIKQPQQQIDDGSAFEWRHYCLDPLFTAYNTQALENMLNQCANNNSAFYQAAATPKISQSSSIFASTNNSKSLVAISIYESKPMTTNKPNLDKNTIVNLTEKFMMNNDDDEDDNDDEPFSVKLVKSRRSLSDSNLFLAIKKRNNKQQRQQYDDQSNEISCNKNNYNQVKSEMRDRNVLGAYFNNKTSPPSNSLLNNTNQSTESYDILSGYFIDSSSSQQQQSSPNEIVQHQRLKCEMDHLILQLQYERHLREKYEESSNRLYSFKIERDQLQMEKSFLEINLKQLVERYKNEVEESLNAQNKVELSAYKREIDEKDALIENLLRKQKESDELINEWRNKFEQMKSENSQLEMNHSRAIQQLEKEQTLNLKHQIDSTYVKSLRYTIDLMRKKLLVLSKSQQQHQLKLQQQMQFAYSHQDLNEVPLMFETTASTFNSSFALNESSETTTTKNVISPFVYQYQQNVIESLQQQMDSLKTSYNRLEIEHNENAMELAKCKQQLQTKERKLDELNQIIEIDFIETNSELVKTHRRVYQSICNVNKRLEMEISRLRAELDEKRASIEKLTKLLGDNNNKLNRLIFQQ